MHTAQHASDAQIVHIHEHSPGPPSMLHILGCFEVSGHWHGLRLTPVVVAIGTGRRDEVSPVAESESDA